MPYIAIKAWPGKDRKEQMEIAKAIVKTYSETAGIPLDAFALSYEEIPKDEWDQKVKQADYKRLEEENKVLFHAGPKNWD